MKYHQGLPGGRGWKRYMTGQDEYSPEYQDEYQRLWHEAARARDRYQAALELIASGDCPAAAKGIAADALNTRRDA